MRAVCGTAPTLIHVTYTVLRTVHPQVFTVKSPVTHSQHNMYLLSGNDFRSINHLKAENYERVPLYPRVIFPGQQRSWIESPPPVASYGAPDDHRTSYSGLGSLVILRVRRLRDVATRPPRAIWLEPVAIGSHGGVSYNIQPRVMYGTRRKWEARDKSTCIWYLAHTDCVFRLPA